MTEPTIRAWRWVMTAPGAALERAAFEPVAGPGEVVIAVAGCGVCHTDLGFWHDGVRTNHPLPLALGHEIAGRVVAAGAGAEAWSGRAVIVPAVLPCGSCAACAAGRPNICRAQRMPGNDIHGGFASHVVVPARGLCPVDEARLAAVGLDLARVSVVADALTTPYQAVVRAEVEPGDLVIVVGAGGVGGYCIQVARAFGATVAAIDVDPGRREAAAQAGAALTLDPRAADAKVLKAALSELGKAHGARAFGWKIFECSGTAAGQQTAFGLLGYGAVLSVVGFTMDRVELRLSNLMAFDARAIGNWGCPPDLYPAALELVLDGRVRVEPFVRTYPLDSIQEVFDAALERRLTQRAVLVPAPEPA